MNRTSLEAAVVGPRDSASSIPHTSSDSSSTARSPRRSTWQTLAPRWRRLERRGRPLREHWGGSGSGSRPLPAGTAPSDTQKFPGTRACVLGRTGITGGPEAARGTRAFQQLHVYSVRPCLHCKSVPLGLQTVLRPVGSRCPPHPCGRPGSL